jgi:hypothetical protein
MAYKRRFVWCIRVRAIEVGMMRLEDLLGSITRWPCEVKSLGPTISQATTLHS